MMSVLILGYVFPAPLFPTVPVAASISSRNCRQEMYAHRGIPPQAAWDGSEDVHFASLANMFLLGWLLEVAKRPGNCYQNPPIPDLPFIQDVS
jgi:hypothetical protein